MFTKMVEAAYRACEDDIETLKIIAYRYPEVACLTDNDFYINAEKANELLRTFESQEQLPYGDEQIEGLLYRLLNPKTFVVEVERALDNS